MVERIRSFDWRATPIGPIETWPTSLRTATTLMLGTRQPAYIAWGPDLTSLYNDGYIPILGRKHAAALGQPFAHLWAEIWEDFRSLVAATMNGEPQYFEDMPVALAGRAGRPMSWFTFSWTPLRDESGQVAGFYCAAHETTDKVNAARESAERLQLAIDAANLGTFVWHVEEDRTDSDERMMRLFGLTPDGVLNLAEALGKLIHPGDRGRYAAAVGRAIDPSGDGVLREDIRLQHPDGSEHWIAVTGQATFEEAPRRAIRLNGTAADVTARKREEARARERTDQASFLVSLADALRPLEDPIAMQATASRMVLDHLRANRVAYFEVTAGDYSIERDATDGVPSLRGRFPIDWFGSTLLAALQSGRPVVVDDIGEDPTLSPQEKGAVHRHSNRRTHRRAAGQERTAGGRVGRAKRGAARMVGCGGRTGRRGRRADLVGGRARQRGGRGSHQRGKVPFTVRIDGPGLLHHRGDVRCGAACHATIDSSR